MKLDAKSAFIGLVLAGCLALVVGQTRTTESPAAPPPTPRYQISAWGQGGDFVHGAFVIDTQSGEVFSAVGFTELVYNYGNNTYEREIWKYSPWKSLGKPAAK